MEMGTNFLWFNLNRRTNPKTGRPYVDPVKQTWFHNVRFRRAVSHAANRQGMARNIFYGLAEPLYGPIPPVNRFWYNPNIPRYPYNPAEAKRLLKASGYIDRNGDGVREDRSGHRLSLVLLVQADNRERQGMADILRNDLARVGIECVVSAVDFNTMITKLRSTFDYDAMLLGLTGGVPPDPSQSSNVLKSSGRTHFWNPEEPSPSTSWEAEVDSLMDVQISLMDGTLRKKAFDRVQAIIAEVQPAIYLVSRRGFLAVRNRFQGLEPTVLRPWVLWRSEAISLRAGKDGTEGVR